MSAHKVVSGPGGRLYLDAGAPGVYAGMFATGGSSCIAVGPSSATGSINDRRLRRIGGGDDLRYDVFQDQRGTRTWGDGTTGGSPLVVTVRGEETIGCTASSMPGRTQPKACTSIR